jgi:chromosome segregation ATPase
MSIEDDKRRSQFKISMYAHAERNRLTTAELLMVFAQEVHAVTASAIDELDFNHEQPREAILAKLTAAEERIEDLELELRRTDANLHNAQVRLDTEARRADQAQGERDSLRHVHQQNAELRQQIERLVKFLDTVGMHVSSGEAPFSEAYWAALLQRNGGHSPYWSDIALSPGEFADWAFEEGLR